MSWDEEERRVAEIFGVKEGEALPDVSRKTLKTYHAYLRANVKFPFKAKVEDLDGDETIQSLFALKDCPEPTFYGLFVRGHHGRRRIEIPIVDIYEVPNNEKTNLLVNSNLGRWKARWITVSSPTAKVNAWSLHGKAQTKWILLVDVVGQ